jgi:pimeloyl-ACP methyl ester carboxylesterase
VQHHKPLSEKTTAPGFAGAVAWRGGSRSKPRHLLTLLHVDGHDERWVEDLHRVVEASGVERFALFGMSQGVSVAVGYAAKYPERAALTFVLSRTRLQATWDSIQTAP